MCIICVEFNQGRLSHREAHRNLGEMVEKIGDVHTEEVKHLLDDPDRWTEEAWERWSMPERVSWFWEEVERHVPHMSATARWLLLDRFSSFASGEEAVSPNLALSVPMTAAQKRIQETLDPASGKVDDLVAWANIQVLGRHEVELYLEEGDETYDMVDVLTEAGWLNPYGTDTATCLRRPGLVTDTPGTGSVVASKVETGYVNHGASKRTLLRTHVTARCMCCETLSYAAGTGPIVRPQDLAESVEILALDKHPCKDGCSKVAL